MINKIILLVFTLTTIYNEVYSQCRGFDKPCEGSHGSQANCCSGYYCHKSNPNWAQGMCYNRNGVLTNSVDTGPGQCVPHDQPCVGDHGTQANCCSGDYCHKPYPNWAQGRCWHREGGSSVTASGGQCLNHDTPCEGVHGSRSNCCEGLYCHKASPNWAKGMCYKLPVVPADYYVRASQRYTRRGTILSNPKPCEVGRPCHGYHGYRETCCTGMYCHTSSRDYASQGQCHDLPVRAMDFSDYDDNDL